ncbi:relaxase/mobilization nuclease domain-containing protein [Thomasclavelia ramosa]|jgi:hypothetical protein|uniref:relaxase/mobilization nuclease domain-containing protein n=1 Tax=Thomasclavelia ramosa TaxID=1547 RepID=UPI0034A497F4
MATTKIWAVKDNLKRVLEYASNPDKTENKSLEDYEYKGLANVIQYTTNDLKTEKQLYVSGVNCDVNHVYEQMIATKKAAHKEDGVLAFHCYQSFREGEVTPEIAHAIGVELAQKMWGNDFEVLVTTHLDKKHFHNHFVVNSVSWTTHKRFLNKHIDYHHFRTLSDELCKQYALSVVENPKKGTPYSAWLAEKQKQPTKRTLIIDDVERAINNSRTFTQFVTELKSNGYEVKANVKHIAIKPPGSPRFFRLYKISKDGKYTEDNIRERILSNTLFVDGPIKAKRKTFYFQGDFDKQKKLTGIKALYYHYMYLMGIIPNHAPKRVHFLLKEDLRYMDKITKEATLLSKKKINTLEELHQKEDEVKERIDQLVKERRCFYNKVKRCRNLETKEKLQIDISTLSNEIKELRKEVRLYEEIKERSIKMEDKLEQVKQQETSKDRTKEKVMKNK